MLANLGILSLFIASEVLTANDSAKPIAPVLDEKDSEDMAQLFYTPPPPEPKPEQKPKKQAVSSRTINVEATYYTADCEGCSGITYSGVDVRNTIWHEGKRVIAVDPSVIPIGTSVIVRTDNGETFEATAQDIGSAIKGARIDILVGDRAEALRLGRVGATVEIIE